MNDRRNNSRGFTLIEMMLAMWMGATVLLILFVSLNIAIKAKRSGENAVTPSRTAAIAIDMISRDLESVPPPNATEGMFAGPFIGTPQNGNAAGEADVLDFYTIGEDAPPLQQTLPLSEGIRFVELALKTDTDPPVLVRRIQRDLLSQQQTDPEEQVICRNVRSLTLRYYDGTDWYDTWDSTTVNNTLPLAVQLTIEIARDPTRPKDGPVFRVAKTIPLACGTDASLTTTDTTTTP
jgi:type II secretion system protein J